MSGAWGDGLATIADAGELLDVAFGSPRLGEAPATHERKDASVARDELRAVRLEARRVVIEDLDAPPADGADAYLRLHLLSHRLVRPNAINLSGIFSVLATVCFTSFGPVLPDELDAVRIRARDAGRYLEVHGLDKFPKMLDYVAPSGVRIADARRVRLGAHLAEGTVVMHEGFVNFNAGTLGPVMVEGRISQGVVVGANSDVGGGASIMGTLSGGGSEVIAVGEQCLLGANSGIGISLGDGCVVEAGLYLTSGTVVTLADGRRVKARELSGAAGMLYRRNSMTGVVEALERSGAWGALNPALHAAAPPG